MLSLVILVLALTLAVALRSSSQPASADRVRGALDVGNATLRLGFERVGWEVVAPGAQLQLRIAHEGGFAQVNVDGSSLTFRAKLAGTFPDQFMFTVTTPERMFCPPRRRTGLAAEVAGEWAMETTPILKIMASEALAELAMEDVRLSGRATALSGPCFATNVLPYHARSQPLVPTRFVVRGNTLEFDARFAPIKRSVLVGPQHVVSLYHQSFAMMLGEVLRDLLGAMKWEHEGALAPMINLSLSPQLDPHTRAIAARARDARMTPAQAIAWRADQVLSSTTSRDQRHEALRDLITHHPHHPVLDRILKAAHEPMHDHVLKALLEQGQELIERELRGSERAAWLNLLYDERSWLSRELTLLLPKVARMEDVFNPAITQQARCTLLEGLLRQHGDERLGPLITHLIHENDDTSLVILLDLLKEHGGVESARALVTLIHQTNKLDTQAELASVFRALVALAPGHHDILATQEVETFLCRCAESPNAQTSARALAPLRLLGGVQAFQRLLQLLKRPTLGLKEREIEDTALAIKRRLLSSGADFSGGLSIAAQQGGDVSIARAPATSGEPE